RGLRSGAANGELLQCLDIGAQRDRQLESHDEHERREDHQEDAESEYFAQLELVAAEARADDEHHAREQHADGLEKDAEENDRDKNVEDRSPVELLELRVLARLGMSKC